MSYDLDASRVCVADGLALINDIQWLEVYIIIVSGFLLYAGSQCENYFNFCFEDAAGRSFYYFLWLS